MTCIPFEGRESLKANLRSFRGFWMDLRSSYTYTGPRSRKRSREIFILVIARVSLLEIVRRFSLSTSFKALNANATKTSAEEPLFGPVLQLYALVFKQRCGTNAVYTRGYPSVDVFAASPAIVSKSSGLSRE